MIVSYSRLKENIRGRKISVRLNGCRCGSVWCRRCGKKGQKRISERIRGMDWRRVRHIVLTVDRGKFDDGEHAYDEIRNKKVIKGMVRNFRRVMERNVGDWIWVLEFHKDGFPHWHVLVEVEAGKMIGRDVLKRYWPYGFYLREEFMHDEDHWKRLSGYFDKHGYFGDKGSQSRLPGWALDKYGIIVTGKQIGRAHV